MVTKEESRPLGPLVRVQMQCEFVDVPSCSSAVREERELEVRRKLHSKEGCKNLVLKYV